MQKVFGYCRISTAKQNIERQVRNILTSYPEAEIYKERYTGTKVQGHRELDKILRLVQPGDTIVFDSVSRMSRNAAEGVELYMSLYEKGVELVFLKEPHINTATYKQALSKDVPLTGEDVDLILQGVNTYLKRLAVRQIELAFVQAQKEVDDLHKRTSEGIETARRNGKRIGTPKGETLTVKKKAPALAFIAKHSREFGGNLNDTQCAAAAGISRKTFYKYKEELQILELISKVEFITEENHRRVLPYHSDEANDKYFKDLQECAELLKKKYKGEVTGLWFIRVPSVDGGIQTITRTVTRLPVEKRLQLAGDTFDYCCDELHYSFTNDDINRLCSVPIREWLEEGEVFAVFDTERTD